MPGSSLNDWLNLLERRHPREVDLGLDRVRVVWQRLGSPRPGRRIVVVAGTNGKGSTVATIGALVEALGHDWGSYTTPHIRHYNERVRIGGCAVSDDLLIAAFERIEQARGDVSLSYFEFGTLAAFLILQDHDPEYAVMEIGLGGRLDAVNLLDGDCTVITPIGLDHQEYLGETLEEIGQEKAGILRSGRLLVLGDRKPPRSVLARAVALDVPVRRIGVDFDMEPVDEGARFTCGGRVIGLPAPVLAGPHQFDNAATALAAVLHLVPTAIDRPERLAAGLRAVRLHGRFEKVADAPAVWIDVGHNPLGARSVAGTIVESRAGGFTGRLRCVLGMLADKDAGAAAAELAGVVSDWYCAGLGSVRGQSGAQLADKIRTAVAPAPVSAFADVATALRAAIGDSAAGDGVLVFGSFLTADAALQALGTADTDARTTGSA